MAMTQEQLLEYLDNAIRRWRVKRGEASSEEDRLVASCYVDAYQSVRVSAFGKTLPEESQNADPQ